MQSYGHGCDDHGGSIAHHKSDLITFGTIPEITRHIPDRVDHGIFSSLMEPVFLGAPAAFEGILRRAIQLLGKAIHLEVAEWAPSQEKTKDAANYVPLSS